MDSQNQEIEITEDNKRGDILVRSPSIMHYYRSNPTATAETIVDGWLHTGDIGYQNQGKWYIVDRAKDLIKVRGWQVSPAELEACLVEHPSIRDAAVIGFDAKDDRGELPRAYIVLEVDAGEVDDEDVKSYLKGRLANYKALAGGVRRLDAIPRSASGKILKPILRALARREFEPKEEAALENEVIKGNGVANGAGNGVSLSLGLLVLTVVILYFR